MNVSVKISRPHLFTGIILILLFASLALNWILYSYAQQYYLQLNGTRLDPLGLTFHSFDNPPDMPIPGKIRIVFFGDSRVANWPTPSDMADFEFINRGIGAQTSVQALQRFDYHVKPLQPQVVIVQTCINDLKTIPLFPALKKTIIANCKENIRQTVTKSTDLDAIVILTTIFPISEVPLERRLFWSPEVAQAIDEVNIYIRSLEASNVIIFDAFSILVDENGNTQSEYAYDLLHFNSAGYEALNRELIPILNRLK
jgi:lysophospholipase L1-like esterase